MPNLHARQDIMNTANDIKGAFTSWDGCMSKAYCKWPVIVGIIIGSLIALLLLWCVGRCLCCGKDLVCCCFRCCGRKNQDHKQLESVPPTPYQGQYQSHGPPIYGANSFSQTATFEGKVHADSLPAMPSWETASSKKVEVIEAGESHEMERLKNDASPHLSGTVSPPARPIPMRNGSAPSSAPASPRLPGYTAGNSPYGQPSGYGSRTDVYNSRTDLTANTAAAGYRGTPTSNPAKPVQSNDRYGDDRYGNDRYANSPYSGSTSNQNYGGNTSQGYSGRSNQGYGGSNQGYGGSNQGYGNTSQGYGGNSTQTYGANNSSQAYGNSDRRSPAYSPSGTTAQDYGYDNYDSRSQTKNNAYQTYNAPAGNVSSPYGGGNRQNGGGSNPYGGGRQANGSWRDI